MSDAAYPEMRIVQASPEEACDHLLAIGEMSRYLHGEICKPTQLDDRSMILANLVMRSAIELEALARALEGPIEVVAWRARNLFEVNLRTRYLLSKPGATSDFISEVFSDDINLLDGLLEMWDAPDEDQEPIRKRKEQQLAALAKRGLQPVKYKNVADLATAVGVKKEYRIFYRLYSKYVHPSAFLIGRLKSAEVWDRHARHLLVGNGNTYAVDTMKRISAATGLPFRPAA